MAERVGFEPTCRLITDKTISSRPRYGHFGTSPFVQHSPAYIISGFASRVSAIIRLKCRAQRDGAKRLVDTANSYPNRAKMTLFVRFANPEAKVKIYNKNRSQEFQRFLMKTKELHRSLRGQASLHFWPQLALWVWQMS